MSLFNDDPRIGRIANFYGFDRQKEKTIEETAELTVEIKHLAKEDNSSKYLEELIDAKIMVDQLLYFALKGYLTRPYVEKMYEFKVECELKRMEGKE